MISLLLCTYRIRRVWRYQSGNHNPYAEEGQKTQWPKEREWSTKHTHNTKDRVTRSPLKIGDELRKGNKLCWILQKLFCFDLHRHFSSKQIWSIKFYIWPSSIDKIRGCLICLNYYCTPTCFLKKDFMKGGTYDAEAKFFRSTHLPY